MSGIYPRLNGEMVKRREGIQGIFSVVGELVSRDTEILTIKACDGIPVTYAITPDFICEQDGRVVEIIGALDPTSGSLAAFVLRDLGNDFDLRLYNDLITKVIPKHSEYFTA